MISFMEAWVTLCKLGAPSGKSLEETCLLVLEASNQNMGPSFFLSQWRNVLGEGYTVMESFGDHMPYFVTVSCYKGWGQGDIVNHLSLADQFSIVLNMLEGEETAKGEEPHHYLNEACETGRVDWMLPEFL